MCFSKVLNSRTGSNGSTFWTVRRSKSAVADSLAGESEANFTKKKTSF